MKSDESNFVEAAVVVSTDQAPLLVVDGIQGESRFEAGGKVFCEVQRAEWERTLGFYDWLRDEAGQLQGLRIMFFDEIPHWFADLNARGVVRVTTKLVHLPFVEPLRFDEERSDDQLLGSNRFFVADDGSMALTFLYPR